MKTEEKECKICNNKKEYKIGAFNSTCGTSIVFLIEEKGNENEKIKES